ncbi:MAG TPA: FAD-dependent oxidoreductase [Candidatus Kapabacteria bacterium]|nr:FAD-dependent oxidoreductase [Candidatus Kapabacteria bacterium]
MTEKKLKILNSNEIARGTNVFHLSKPEGFEYEPGQTIDLTLLDPKEMDAEGPVRTFSLVSAPHEPELMFATRMRDTSFKRALKNAQPGMELAWDGPYGSFIMHRNAAKPAVFLAGGIGITPFMSMVKHADHQKLPHQIYLFHSNHTPEDSPFLSDLTEFEKQNPQFHYIPTMTDLDSEANSPSYEAKRNRRGLGGGSWSGERGFVDKPMIERHVSDLSTPIYYMAGPAGFVTAMRKMLVEAKVDEDSIRFEEFPGY